MPHDPSNKTLREARASAAEAKNDAAGYGFTVDSIEPDVWPIDASAFYASAAISLKRIADAGERIADLFEAREKRILDYWAAQDANKNPEF